MGSTPTTCRTRCLARAALERAFVVSLEIRESAVHEYADVILPVAPQQEKAGAYADWEGRLRTFDRAIDSNALSDHAVLDLLAAEMGVRLGARSLTELRHEMTGLGTWAGLAVAPACVPPVAPPSPGEGEAVLATWHHLLDAGSLQDGEPFLAGTAPVAVARLSAATAAGVGGAPTAARSSGPTAAGASTLPVAGHRDARRRGLGAHQLVGSAVRATLGVDAGAVVSLDRRIIARPDG